MVMSLVDRAGAKSALSHRVAEDRSDDGAAYRSKVAVLKPAFLDGNTGRTAESSPAGNFRGGGG
jgi:hypothetical protein